VDFFKLSKECCSTQSSPRRKENNLISLTLRSLRLCVSFFPQITQGLLQFSIIPIPPFYKILRIAVKQKRTVLLKTVLYSFLKINLF